MRKTFTSILNLVVLGGIAAWCIYVAQFRWLSILVALVSYR